MYSRTRHAHGDPRPGALLLPQWLPAQMVATPTRVSGFDSTGGQAIGTALLFPDGCFVALGVLCLESPGWG